MVAADTNRTNISATENSPRQRSGTLNKHGKTSNKWYPSSIQWQRSARDESVIASSKYYKEAKHLL
jgi:hypothetical protein